MAKAKIRIGGQWVEIGGTSLSDVQSEIDQAISELETKINNADEYINGSFKDGIINVIEAKKIESFLKALDIAKTDFDQRYQQVHDNPKLSAQTKTNLETSKTNTDNAYNNLVTTINNVIADGKATDDEKASVENAFTAYNNELSLLSSIIEAAKREITDGLDNRLTTAEAQITQNTNEIQLRVTETEYQAGLNQTLQDAKNYTDSVTAPLQQQIDDTNAYIDGSFKDGIIYDSEYRKIQGYLNTLQAKKTELDDKYNQVYTNTNLTDPEKTNLATAKSDYDTAYNNLITSINNAIADQKATPAESADVDAKFTAYRNALGVLASAFESAVYKINTTYTNGVTDPINQRLTTAESSITQLSNEINLKVSQTDYNGNTIASLINQTATTVQILASKINLVGQVNFSHFDNTTQQRVDNQIFATPGATTQIDGSNIKTGTISFDQAYGGTIKLGGAAYGNASLYMFQDTGDTMVQIDQNNRGFDYINVGRVNSAYVVRRDPDLFANGGITLYVDPVGGDDTNDGLTTNTQKKTVQGAINSLPKYLDQDVTIQVKSGSGTMYEAITIHGFNGRGNLTLNYVGFSNVLIGTIEIYNCASQVAITNLKIAYPQYNTTGIAVIYIHNSAVTFYNCQIYGRNIAQSGIRARYGSRVRCQEVSFFDLERGMDLQYASYGAFWNTYGNPSNYAAVFGSEILCYGSRANGNEIVQEGGALQWYGQTKPNGSAGNYNPPYTLGSGTTQTTTQFTPTGYDSWRTVYNAWRRDGKVIQGQYSGYGVHRGFWFFGTNVSSAVTGKTILNMRVYVKRQSSGGNSSSVPIYIRHHALTALPGNDNQPSVSSEYATVKLSWGGYAWVTLPSSFYSYFQSGSSKGICVYTTDTSNNGYAILDPSSFILEITYQ